MSLELGHHRRKDWAVSNAYLNDSLFATIITLIAVCVVAYPHWKSGTVDSKLVYNFIVILALKAIA